ncbi:TPA: AAC(3) family N-acetyltransferase [Campylobacter coli]|nr:AAC(3) family N-acetyltransferase [Campylobacter coli]
MEKILKFINCMDLKKEDFLLFTGNLMQLLQGIDGDNRKKLDFLLDCIKNNVDTLAIHTFNWDFCRGMAYDILKSKSQTGALGNIALKRSDFRRTKHPIYSFAVVGKFQNELVALENKGAFDSNSPFNFMHKNNAKMIIVNLPLQDSFTFVHYVEECLKVDYRFNKSFEALYTDEKGFVKLKTYDMFVRKDGILTNVNGLENLFIKEGAMELKKFENLYIKKIDLSKAYEIIAKDIQSNQARNLMSFA